MSSPSSPGPGWPLCLRPSRPRQATTATSPAASLPSGRPTAAPRAQLVSGRSAPCGWKGWLHSPKRHRLARDRAGLRAEAGTDDSGPDGREAWRKKHRTDGGDRPACRAVASTAAATCCHGSHRGRGTLGTAALRSVWGLTCRCPLQLRSGDDPGRPGQPAALPGQAPPQLRSPARRPWYTPGGSPRSRWHRDTGSTRGCCDAAWVAVRRQRNDQADGGHGHG